MNVRCRLLLVASILLVLVPTLQADEQDTISPPNAEPRWRVISVEDGAVTLHTFKLERVMKEVPYTVAVPVTTKRVINGKEVRVTSMKQEQRVRTVTMTKPVPTTAILDKFALYRLDGKRLSNDDVSALEGKRLPVIAMHKGEKVDPFFKTILKPDAIVLITSQELLGPVTPPPPAAVAPAAIPIRVNAAPKKAPAPPAAPAPAP